MVSKKAKQGFIMIGVISALFFALGYATGCKVNRAPEGGRNDYIAGSTATHYDPSDVPPEGLPAGTVAYEVYDNAANMRYWVFRWPNATRTGESQWSVVPRVTQDDSGALVAYVPASVTAGDAE